MSCPSLKKWAMAKVPKGSGLSRQEILTLAPKEETFGKRRPGHHRMTAQSPAVIVNGSLAFSAPVVGLTK